MAVLLVVGLPGRHNPIVQGRPGDELLKPVPKEKDPEPPIVKPPVKDPEPPLVAKPPVKDPEPPLFVKPPVKDPEPPLFVKPPVKDPEPPLLVKPPVVAGKFAAEFIIELPRPAGRAVLSADGSRVAYTLTPGTFGYRMAPNFDFGKVVAVDGTLTAIHPLASSADGRKMAFTAGSRDGPKIYIWDWPTMQVEMAISVPNLAISSTFSPDGNYLATYLIKTLKAGGVEYWLHLHEVQTGKHPIEWKLGSAPNFFGFSPDSGTVYFAQKDDQVGALLHHQKYRGEHHRLSARLGQALLLPRFQQILFSGNPVSAKTGLRPGAGAYRQTRCHQ